MAFVASRLYTAQLIHHTNRPLHKPSIVQTIQMSQPKLFTPIQVGNAHLTHRVVLAPLTRARANAQHVPSKLAVEYYSQRASVPGTMLISEGVIIAAKATGMAHIPGIWSDEQIAAWKLVELCAYFSLVW